MAASTPYSLTGSSVTRAQSSGSFGNFEKSVYFLLFCDIPLGYAQLGAYTIQVLHQGSYPGSYLNMLYSNFNPFLFKTQHTMIIKQFLVTSFVTLLLLFPKSDEYA